MQRDRAIVSLVISISLVLASACSTRLGSSTPEVPATAAPPSAANPLPPVDEAGPQTVVVTYRQLAEVIRAGWGAGALSAKGDLEWLAVDHAGKLVGERRVEKPLEAPAIQALRKDLDAAGMRELILYQPASPGKADGSDEMLLRLQVNQVQSCMPITPNGGKPGDVAILKGDARALQLVNLFLGQRVMDAKVDHSQAGRTVVQVRVDGTGLTPERQQEEMTGLLLLLAPLNVNLEGTYVTAQGQSITWFGRGADMNQWAAYNGDWEWAKKLVGTAANKPLTYLQLPINATPVSRKDSLPDQPGELLKSLGTGLPRGVTLRSGLAVSNETEEPLLLVNWDVAGGGESQLALLDQMIDKLVYEGPARELRILVQAGPNLRVLQIDRLAWAFADAYRKYVKSPIQEPLSMLFANSVQEYLCRTE